MTSFKAFKMFYIKKNQLKMQNDSFFFVIFSFI